MMRVSVLSFPSVRRLVDDGKIDRADVARVQAVSEDAVLEKLVEMGLVTWSDVARARIEVAKSLSPAKGSLVLLREARRAHLRSSAALAGLTARKVRTK